MDGEILQTARELFSLIDKQRKGFILIDELCDVSVVDGINFTESQLRFVFSALDKDGEGKITLEDFTEAFVALSGEKHSEKRHGSAEGLSLLSAELERDERVLDVDPYDVSISCVNSDGMQSNIHVDKTEDLRSSATFKDFNLTTITSTNDTEKSCLGKTHSDGTSNNDNHDDVFEGEGLMTIETQSTSSSPSRPQFARSPSLKHKRFKEKSDSLSSSTDCLNELEIRDRLPPDGNECSSTTRHRSPRGRSRKSVTNDYHKGSKINPASTSTGFAKEAIVDLLKIVDAHTLSNLGLYDKNGRPWRRDITCSSSNFFGENFLGNERNCPRWLHTSQDWTESSRPDSRISKNSDYETNDFEKVSSEPGLSDCDFTCNNNVRSERPFSSAAQDLSCISDEDTSDSRRGIFSPTSDYSQSSENQSDFNPTYQMDDRDPNANFIPHEDQPMCIGARVDNETVGNLIFENTDESHVGLYDRILSYSGVELNSRHSASETSLHDLILEAEVARKSASMVEDWDSVIKRINGVSLFGGNQTVRYLWQQLSVYHSDLVQPFEDFLKSIIAEVQRAYMKCQELDSLLISKAEQHERELARVYEEMDQLLSREKEQLQDKHSEKEDHLRAEFNRILEMKENDLLDALRSKAEIDSKLERVVDDYQLLKSSKERLDKQLSVSIALEAQLRNENDCLAQENHILSDKLDQRTHNVNEMQDQVIKLSKVAEANNENYRRCFRKYQDALEEREYFDMNINNLTQELEDLRNANKSLQERVDSNLNTSILWRDEQSSPRSIDSPDLQRKRGSRLFGFPNGIMPISNSQRNSLVSEPSFEDATPDVTVTHAPSLPVPDVIPPMAKAAAPMPQKITSTPVKAPNPRPVFNTGKEYKVIFVGDAAVGKSSLIRKICRGTFSSKRETTTNPDCHSQTVTVENRSVKLNLWDTVGQERCTYTLKVEGFEQQLTFRFNSLPPSYFRRADVVVLVYDVIEEMSFLNVKSWMKTIYEYTDENVLLVLCGNKNDLDHRRKVKEQRAANLATLNDAIFLESSAKTGYNVPKLCELIASTLLERDDTVLIRENSVKIFEHDFLNISRSNSKSCC